LFLKNYFSFSFACEDFSRVFIKISSYYIKAVVLSVFQQGEMENKLFYFKFEKLNFYINKANQLAPKAFYKGADAKNKIQI